MKKLAPNRFAPSNRHAEKSQSSSFEIFSFAPRKLAPWHTQFSNTASCASTPSKRAPSRSQPDIRSRSQTRSRKSARRSEQSRRSSSVTSNSNISAPSKLQRLNTVPSRSSAQSSSASVTVRPW